MPQGITYNPWPEESGGFVIFKNIISRAFNYVEKIAISKFWSDLFGQMVGVGGELAALQSLWTIEKGTSPFNFQSNWPFSKFLRYEKYEMREGGIHLPITMNLKKYTKTSD